LLHDCSFQDAELFRVRVDQHIEKARAALVANGRENWLGEGLSTEEDLTNIKVRTCFSSHIFL
jgi:hypothetical protein